MSVVGIILGIFFLRHAYTRTIRVPSILGKKMTHLYQVFYVSFTFKRSFHPRLPSISTVEHILYHILRIFIVCNFSRYQVYFVLKYDTISINSVIV